MILHTGQVLKVEEWNKNKGRITKVMRNQIEEAARIRDYIMVGPEEVLIVEIRHNGREWVSAKGANITHVKVTMQQAVEHA